MSDVTVAVVSDGAVRAYHRNGGAMAQVAQLAIGVEVDPAAIAALMADLGGLLGWHSDALTVQPAPSAARSMPASRKAAELPAVKRPRGRAVSGQAEAERADILAIVRGAPGILRTDVARIAGLDLPAVKRRTEELLAHGLIEARPLPGVPERGKGGGHGLFAVQSSASAAPDAMP